MTSEDERDYCSISTTKQLPKKISAKDMIEQQSKQVELLSKPQSLNIKLISEQKALEWLRTIKGEISDIEKFYNRKLDELINKFIRMQARYLIKLENDKLDANSLHNSVADGERARFDEEDI